MILLLGYFNVYTILPVIAIILLGTSANFLTIREYKHIPKVLLVFMNVFVPICFATRHKEDISKAQLKNLMYQAWNCSTIYGLALIVLGLLVSLSQLKMNPNIPINFEMFIILVTSVFALGILVILFSFRMELQDTMNTLKKMTFLINKILRLSSLLALITTSTTLLLITPTDSSTYLVIWKNTSSQPEVFNALKVTPLENPVMNLHLNDLDIIRWEEIEKRTDEVQNNKKLAVVLNDQPSKNLKPSSPKPFQSSFNIPVIIIPKEVREKFEDAINDYNRKYLIHISVKFKSWHDYHLPLKAQGK